MKNFSFSFTKFMAVAACVLTLGSCNRAEYATLPKGGSYHGVTRVATPIPNPTVAKTSVSTEASVAPDSNTEPVVQASPIVAQPTKAGAPASAAVEPKAPAVATVLGSDAVSVPATIPALATPARKLNSMQRLAVSKVARKLEKASHKVATHHDNTAATSALSGKLRQGLVLLLIGLLIGIVGSAVGGSIGAVIGLLGLIMVIVGGVLIILYLLDNV